MPVIVTQQLHQAVAAFAGIQPFRDYINPDNILVLATRGRAGPTGKRAACHFTRFRKGDERRSTDGDWELPSVTIHGQEIRYIIVFVLPRFLFLTPEEQGEDIVHELLHIDVTFDGSASPRRHGKRYDSLVKTIAARGRQDGVHVPPLGTAGEQILYQRLRPLPHPYLRTDPQAKRSFDEGDVESAAMTINPRDRFAPAPKYLYRCPSCGEEYGRQKPFRMASCGICADTYDGRFKLKRVKSPSMRHQGGHD